MPDLPAEKADPWTREAARLPLAFAQVREDPRLDGEIASRLPVNATVVMIASGGETLVELARHPRVGRILAVDMNEAQIAISLLKCHLARNVSPDESCRLLGHEAMPPEERLQAMIRLLATLEAPENIFGPPDAVAAYGVDHAGRYERCFAELRRKLCPKNMFAEETRRDAALAQIMSLANLVALFGQEATQNPARSFHEHFADRTRIALRRADASDNPFLWQMYRGCFPVGHRYDWLKSNAPPSAEILTHHGRMRATLDGLPEAGADFIHLSNILDWLSGEEAAATLASARRVLRPGGWLILRQLNSNLDFEAIGEGLAWNRTLGAEMACRDRSFFYPRIHAATRL